MTDQRVVWGVFAALGVIYLAGLLLGMGDKAAWHLLLVLVAIVGLFGVFGRRAQGD